MSGGGIGFQGGFDTQSTYMPEWGSGGNQYGSGAGADPLMALLGQLGKSNKGLFGLGDVATSGLLGFGGSLLGGLAGLVKGPSQAQKSAREVFNLAQNRMGQSVIDPDQYLADFMRMMGPRWNAEASAMDRRLGLDSGIAQGELARSRQSGISQFMLNAKKEADILKMQRDQSLMALMAEVGRYT